MLSDGAAGEQGAEKRRDGGIPAREAEAAARTGSASDREDTAISAGGNDGQPFGKACLLRGPRREPPHDPPGRHQLGEACPREAGDLQIRGLPVPRCRVKHVGLVFPQPEDAGPQGPARAVLECEGFALEGHAEPGKSCGVEAPESSLRRLGSAVEADKEAVRPSPRIHHGSPVFVPLRNSLPHEV